MSRIFTRFLKKPTTIGALCASTVHLAEEITSHIDIEKAKTVVELGPGTGAFTPSILKKMSSEASFIAVEIDSAMFQVLKEKFPHLKIYNKDAANLREILDQENLKFADVIISGLPWSAFTPNLQDRILNAIIENLHPQGSFATFAYFQSTILPGGQRFKKRINALFHEVEKTRVVWRNLPPAFVYRCKRKKT